MSETTFIPVTLESVIAAGRHNVDHRTADLYCNICIGASGALPQYGSVILSETLRKIGIEIDKHDPSHNLTAVEDVCGGGLF